jgi:hypothetical protein
MPVQRAAIVDPKLPRVAESLAMVVVEDRTKTAQVKRRV